MSVYIFRALTAALVVSLPFTTFKFYVSFFSPFNLLCCLFVDVNCRVHLLGCT